MGRACLGQLMLFQITSGHSPGHLVVQTPVPLDRLDLLVTLCQWFGECFMQLYGPERTEHVDGFCTGRSHENCYHSEIKLQEKYKQRWRTSGAKVRMWFINKLAWD